MAILTLILAALGLGLLVFIHELGHYFMARHVGIKVEAFSIGFGRPIVRWMRGDVEWRIGWLPFGGYVRMAGTDPKGDLQPHEVPGGFFQARPLNRIKVALAGPIINIVFAFLLFTGMWIFGGREKPFSEFTQRLGWVDTESALYADGIRPGDIITSYDGHPVKSASDHLYAPMMSGKEVRVEGFKVDYTKGLATPFSLDVAPYHNPMSVDRDIMTLGVLSASYLIYDNASNKAATPAIAASGIQTGDRLLWVDGELLFSYAQLQHLLNSSHALITVERGGETRLIRTARLPLTEFALSPELRDEVSDWQFEALAGSHGETPLFIPYGFTSDGTVTGPLNCIDPECEALFVASAIKRANGDILQPGDRIVAVDGAPVSLGAEILKALQSHQVQVIVERESRGWPLISSKLADVDFDRSIHWEDLAALSHSIGLTSTPRQLGNLVLLKPIVPVPAYLAAQALGQSEEFTKRMQEARQRATSVSDESVRSQLLKMIDATEKSMTLGGLPIKDRIVRYNPPPQVLFVNVLGEMGRTLKALFSGYLNPKFLSGPIGIVQVMQFGWSKGVTEALYWLGLVSLNLGILNLLPIPVLDGGQVCFAAYEGITRRRIKPKTMEKLVIPFVILLVGFIIFATYNDLSRLFHGFF